MPINHIFTIIPNNSGSTLIRRFLEKCNNALVFPEEGYAYFYDKWKEIHYGPSDTMGFAPFTEHEEKFTNVNNFQWDKISKSWNEEWNRLYHIKENEILPENSIGVQGSPIDVLTFEHMAEYFDDLNVFYLFSIRNPYAFIEGMNRRHNFSIERCTSHWVKVAYAQIYNTWLCGVKNYPYYSYRYEDLVDNPKAVEKEIKRATAKLGMDILDLDLGKKVKCHSIFGDNYNSTIKNMNDNQIVRLSKENLDIINDLLPMALLGFFGYERIKK